MKDKNIYKIFLDEDDYLDEDTQHFQKIKRKQKINKKPQRGSRTRDPRDDDWN